MPRKRLPSFSGGQLEAIARVLADTDQGLTGSEIGQLLEQVNVRDTDPSMTKWKRLYNALVARQDRDGHGDRVLAFIHAALDPVRYQGKSGLLGWRRKGVNVTLAFVGLEYGEDGKFRSVSPAATLSEAEARADRMTSALQARGVHPDVLRYCRAELVQKNAFHAVLEASKSVFDKVRQRTGLSTDGAALIEAVFAGSDPALKINAFATDSEVSEQKGFANLLKGLYGTFRNPTAHAPRMSWPMSEEDALDLMTLASYAHRRIDKAR